MKSVSGSSKFIAAALILHCGLAFTQESLPRPLPAPTPPDPKVVIGRDVHHGARVTLVSIAEPMRRQSCLVDTFDGETVSCSKDKKVAAASFKETDLVAILVQNEYGKPMSLKRFLATFGFGAGAIAGAAFLISLAPIAAIPVAVIGGIALLDATFEGLGRMQDGPSERVVYLNPTQQLQISLRQ